MESKQEEGREKTAAIRLCSLVTQGKAPAVLVYCCTSVQQTAVQQTRQIDSRQVDYVV